MHLLTKHHIHHTLHTCCSQILNQSLFNSSADSTKAIVAQRSQMDLILDNQNAQELRLKKLEEKVAGMNEEIKQSCNDLASVQQYIDANVAELKEFMAGVTKKLPMPLFVTTEKGKGMLGFGKKVVKLWFICPQVSLHP
jgi:hypothetical protein